MGGLAKGLLGGGEKPRAVSTSTVEVPEWLDSQNKSLVNRAATISNREFTPYTGQRVADFNQDSNTAFSLGRNTIGQYNNLLGQGEQGIYELLARAQGPTSQQISDRTNPYLENVLDTSRRQTLQNYNTTQAQRDREAGMINAFGGSRVAIRQAMADEQLQEDLNDLDYQGRFDAYNMANNQFNRDTDVLQSGINSAFQGAGTGQQYNINDIQTLLSQGELQRLRDQDTLNVSYDDFLSEQAHDYENVNFLANILNPLTSGYAGGRTESQQQGGGGDGLSKALGMASSIAGIAGFLSDERVKENIKEVGELDNGLPVYSFNYKGSPNTLIGLIAQDVEKKKPEAVGDIDGIKTVDYEEATQKFNSGGRVTLGRDPITKARLAGVAGISNPSMPGTLAAPKPFESKQEIDAEGIAAMFGGRGEGKEGGKGGLMDWLGGLFEDGGSGSMTLPMMTDSMTSAIGGFGFNEGGPVGAIKDLSDKQRQGYINTRGYEPFDANDPESSVFMNSLKGAGNKAQDLGTDLLFAPGNAAGALLDGVGIVSGATANILQDFFITPQGELEASNEALKERVSSEKDDKDLLRQIIADKKAQMEIDNNMIQPTQVVGADGDVPLSMGDLDPALLEALGAGDENVNLNDFIQPVSFLDESKINEQYQQPSQSINPSNLPGSVVGEFPLPSYEDYLKVKDQFTGQIPDQEKISKKDNTLSAALLAAGISMMAAKGDDIFDNLSEGLKSATKVYGEKTRAEKEATKLKLEQQQQEMDNYLNYLRQVAYLEQVRKQGVPSPDSYADLLKAEAAIMNANTNRDEFNLTRDLMEGRGGETLDNKGKFKRGKVGGLDDAAAAASFRAYQDSISAE